MTAQSLVNVAENLRSVQEKRKIPDVPEFNEQKIC